MGTTTTTRIENGERAGRPQLTREGADLLAAHALGDIRDPSATEAMVNAIDLAVGTSSDPKDKNANRSNEIIAEATGQSMERVSRDTDRDYWMNAREASVYGLIEKIIMKRDDLPL